MNFDKALTKAEGSIWETTQQCPCGRGPAPGQSDHGPVPSSWPIRAWPTWPHPWPIRSRGHEPPLANQPPRHPRQHVPYPALYPEQAGEGRAIRKRGASRVRLGDGGEKGAVSRVRHPIPALHISCLQKQESSARRHCPLRSLGVLNIFSKQHVYLEVCNISYLIVYYLPVFERYRP